MKGLEIFSNHFPRIVFIFVILYMYILYIINTLT